MMLDAGNCPKLRDDLFVHRGFGRTLYLNSEVPDWIAVRSEYEPIFQQFTKDTTLGEVDKFIQQGYPSEWQLLTRQIRELCNSSYIFAGRRFADRWEQSKSLVQYIYLTLTDKCNLCCVYCYARERITGAESTLDEWRMYVDKMIPVSDSPVFTFTGGEPLVSPFVFELAAYIREIRCKAILLTNGTRITEASVARRIAELFSEVRISLDSTNADTSEVLRGKGVLDSVSKAYELLVEQNCKVSIVSTVTQLNKDQLHDLAVRFDGNVLFQPLYASRGDGRACGSLALSGHQYYNALAGPGLLRQLPGYSQNIHQYKCNPYKRCAMGIEEVSIGPNGDLFPCHLMHVPTLRIANLRTDDVREVLHECTVLSRLRQLNVDNFEQCRVCPVRNFCGGGCRARIGCSLNDIEGHDAFCEFEKQSILDALLRSFG